ncbi:hypothetical protein EV207_108145 [Scopulibacillus darangshiensis]|uniref:Uncharacterized protein n=1 Tax=Scopulibacillus darangshiensis TaxID=442528 RepID=A0A4R2P789_9BACL|nr:hypothetical protein [Scopulibacillus darangshiensis]TCP29851.1 hypothetical protein EV207_108145 [Scopulibacillus darangshiensis]
MKQYVFLFETGSGEPTKWKEMIESRHMFDAFTKAQKLSQEYEKEKSAPVSIVFEGVKYPDIA